MRMTLKTSGLTLLAMLLGVLSAAPAFAVAVSAVSTSGLAGQTVNVSINTASLTGLNVDSFQFQLNYSPGVVTATNIITASTLSGAAGWNSTLNVTNNNGTGQVSGERRRQHATERVGNAHPHQLSHQSRALEREQHRAHVRELQHE